MENDIKFMQQIKQQDELGNGTFSFSRNKDEITFTFVYKKEEPKPYEPCEPLLTQKEQKKRKREAKILKKEAQQNKKKKKGSVSGLALFKKDIALTFKGEGLPQKDFFGWSGKKWTSLPEEDKQKYKDRAKIETKRLAEEYEEKNKTDPLSTPVVLPVVQKKVEDKISSIQKKDEEGKKMVQSHNKQEEDDDEDEDDDDEEELKDDDDDDDDESDEESEDQQPTLKKFK